jgi:glutaredoxin
VAEVVFYTRERCCLCDEALAVIQEAQRSRSFSLRIVDVDGDEALRRRYGEKVPVVVVDGRMHAKYRVDPRRFARRIDGATMSAAR